MSAKSGFSCHCPVRENESPTLHTPTREPSLLTNKTTKFDQIGSQKSTEKQQHWISLLSKKTALLSDHCKPITQQLPSCCFWTFTAACATVHPWTLPLQTDMLTKQCHRASWFYFKNSGYFWGSKMVHVKCESSQKTWGRLKALSEEVVTPDSLSEWKAFPFWCSTCLLPGSEPFSVRHQGEHVTVDANLAQNENFVWKETQSKGESVPSHVCYLLAISKDRK